MTAQTLNLADVVFAIEDELGAELPATAAYAAKQIARRLWAEGERDVTLIGADVAFELAVRGLLDA